jgi:renal tumor antigen
MFEVITLKPLFPGSNELDQISKIHDVLGTPSSAAIDKLQQ